MKRNQDPEDDRSVDKVLGEWVVDAPLPPRFQEQVWQRIAKTEARPEPSGAWAAQRETTRLNAALGSQYVQSVNPYHTGSMTP